MNAYLLLILGWLLVFLEFYLPGAIMAIFGSLLILCSIILFATQSDAAWQVLLFVLVAFVGVAGVIRLAIWSIRKSKAKNSLFLQSDQTGYVASSFNAACIGKKGIALTDLKPGGYILIEDKKYQALSVSGYINKGHEVLVISGQEESLMVKLIKKEHAT